MTRHISSGAIFVLAYSVLFILGSLIAWQVGLRVEAWYPDFSLMAFLGVMGVVIIVAGAIALRITPNDAPEQPH